MDDLESHFVDVARESVGVFEEISRKAESGLEKASSTEGTSLASVNTFNDHRAIALEQQIHSKHLDGLRALTRTPAIARVSARDEDGNEYIFYISSQTNISLDGAPVHASYRSPVGRLAALPPGEELTIPVREKPTVVEVVEVTKFRPSRGNEGWDSKPVHFDVFDIDVVSYASLRSLLRDDLELDSEAELEALLSGQQEPRRLEGIRHEVRSAMALREQPILDRFQDEIFRLTLKSSLMILGPPGTGKTTTLVKRLGQKLDIDILDSDEQRVVSEVDTTQRPFQQSWLMFTPTDLLKHYLREAFNREQVPAPESHIKTWDSTRMELSHQVLGILQSANAQGKFVLKEGLDALSTEVIEDPTSWFDDFRAFHHDRILMQLKAGMEMLETLENEQNLELIGSIRTLMSRADVTNLLQLFVSLDQAEDEILPVVSHLKAEADGVIRKRLVLIFNKNKKFLQELAGFLDSMQAEVEEVTDDDQFDDDLADSEAAQTSIQKAEAVYTRTIRSVARYSFQRRPIPRNSRIELIVEWLGDRLPGDSLLMRIGENIAVQNALRRFVQAHRRFVLDVPLSYKAFRKERAKQEQWYAKMPANARHLSAGELDGIVLLMLQCARGLYDRRRVKQQIERPKFQYLKSITDRFRAQILVDEATDFSPVQLACMRALTMPETSSFFACGDFNQRITVWGTRNIDQLEWASPRMDRRTINYVYRQSRLLNEFSNRLLEIFDGYSQSSGQLPDSSIHDGVKPVLVEHAGGIEDRAIWLYERIEEVERMTGSERVPSIAILVNAESEVEPMAKAMNALLEDINLLAAPCRDGQSLGEQSQIRVFDVRHIKGLEFEAVFFDRVDELADRLPDLFEKYLYVGATRAATYFGMTCAEGLPTPLHPLTSGCAESWREDAGSPSA